MAVTAPIVYHDFEFVLESKAHFDVQDRGVLFADGVYEVVRFDRGKAFAMQAHVDRLARSMAGIGLEGVSATPFAELSYELLERNQLSDAKVYWQVTRGPAARDFVVSESTEPTVTLIAYPTQPIDLDAPLAVGAGHIVEDCRWTRCWIKSLMLMPASLAKTEAVKAGAAEAIFERAKPGTDEKHITEGASTNVFIVREGQLCTHPDDGWVLGGITRQTLLDLAKHLGLPIREDAAFTREQLLAANEAFVCSTTQLTAITSVGDAVIADGTPGPTTQRLHEAYRALLLQGG
ncbi:aminotransferase class IV [Algisphaera agarilytica]|uniref:D-alanine transaminase n=1 Tax=Algisphaera agarilytica TaxID=1385975 RepID=A0A7X0H480_9BACT|nr:aminotransferase class IV [Algisphaera agarilytica]MBB6428788.1 D-alanine transaminase [Algisphaera agarilytica]